MELFSPSSSQASNFTRPKILKIDIVEGMSAIEGMNFEKGRVNATRDGMKNAVKRAIADIIESIPEDSVEMVDFLVESNFEKYTHAYSILTELVDDGFFMNLMSVELFIDKLREDLIDLDLSLSSEKKPLLLILIDERVSPVYSEDNFLTLFSICENALSKNIRENGWDVLGRESVSEMEERPSIREAINGNLEAALLVGGKLQADFLLFGTAEKITEDEIIENESISVTYQVVSMEKNEFVAQGRIAGRSDSNDSFLATAQALRDAGGKLANEFQALLARETGAVEQEESEESIELDMNMEMETETGTKETTRETTIRERDARQF